MMPLFTFLLAWFHSQSPVTQVAICIGVAQAIATFVVGLIPQKYGSNPVVKALGHFGASKFADALGTWKWPLQSARDPQAEPSVVVQPGTSGR